MGFCRNCGNEIKDGETFCPVCGEEIVVEHNSKGTYCLKDENIDFNVKVKNDIWYISNWKRIFRNSWYGNEIKHHLAWIGVHFVVIGLIVLSGILIWNGTVSDDYMLNELEVDDDEEIISSDFRFSDLINGDSQDIEDKSDDNIDQVEQLENKKVNNNKTQKLPSDDTHKYEYDANGNVTKQIVYNSDGSIYKWREYKYDSSGNLTMWISHEPSGSYVVSKYEADKNQTLEIHYDSEGKIVYEGYMPGHGFGYAP